MKLKLCVIVLFISISYLQASESTSILRRVSTSTGIENNKKAQDQLQQAERERVVINQKIAMRVATKNIVDQLDVIKNNNEYKATLLRCAEDLERKFDVKDTKKLNREDKIDKMHTLVIARDSLYPILTHQEDQLISDELIGINQATQKQNCFFMPSSEKIMTKGQSLLTSIQNRLQYLVQENNTPSAPVEPVASAASVTVVVHAHPFVQGQSVIKNEY